MSKKILSVLLAIVVMASLCIVGASADDAQVTANQKSATTGALHAGDTVTFTVSLKYGDETKVLQGLDARINFDTNVLKIANPVMDLDIALEGQDNIVDGTIIFNAANGGNGYNTKDKKGKETGYDFANGQVFVTVTFEVIADAPSTTIEFGTVTALGAQVNLDSTSKDYFKLLTGTDEAITDGFTAKAEVTCPHQTTDSDKKDTDSDKKDTDSAKDTDSVKDTDAKTSDTEAKADSNKAPQTGDMATVVMMLVIASAAVAVVVSKKRA